MQLFFCLSLVGALALTGCGDSDTTTTTPTPVADAGGNSSGDTKTGPGESKDTATDPCSKCKTGEECKDKVCVKKEDPCDKCTSDEECKDKVCIKKVVPCDGACKAGEICDVKADGGKGKCVTPSCKIPTKWGKDVQKVTVLSIPSTKEGCDLDDDGVPNNVLGKITTIAATVNDTIANNVKDGTLVMMFETDAYKTDGSDFGVRLLIGDVDASNPKCDVTKAGCKYSLSNTNYDLLDSSSGDCPPMVNFKDAKVKAASGGGLEMSGGGSSQKFDLTLPLAGIELKLTITQAEIKGTVKGKDAWTETKKGMVCGVLSKENLAAAIDAVPSEMLQELGFDKATVKSLVDGLLKPDIDTDNDGKPDAVSVALGFETQTGEITGMTPDAPADSGTN
jgi:hypothetical protein